MLSGVLRRGKSIPAPIEIMRMLVLMRRYYMDYKELKLPIVKLENEMNWKFRDILDA